MTRYFLTGMARKVGALGNRQTFATHREAETPEQARIALYDEYEHISAVSVTWREPAVDRCEGCAFYHPERVKGRQWCSNGAYDAPAQCEARGTIYKQESV